MHELPQPLWRTLHPFYKANAFEGFPSKRDRVFVKEGNNETILAVALIQSKAGVDLLSGVLVDQSQRQQGIGRDLVKEIVMMWHKECDRPLYCLAQPHLTPFYKACGFHLSKGTAQLMRLKCRYEGGSRTLCVFEV
jgi:N-acetylglutamate synthase-like GNAT family acetyltransferase